MKRQTIAMPMMTLVQLMASPLVLAQAATELDITISVIEEGQTPAEFIQELRLPPPEFFTAGDAATSAITSDPDDVAAALATDITEATGTATETLTNTIRETLSIDGTAAVTAETGLLPDVLVDVLDDDLPLVDTLQDVLDTGAGGVVPPLDTVVGGVDGVVGGVEVVDVAEVVEVVEVAEVVDVVDVVDVVEVVDVVDVVDVVGDVGLDDAGGAPVDDLGIVDNLDPGLDAVMPAAEVLTDALPLTLPDSKPLQDSLEVEATGETMPGADLDALPQLPDPVTDDPTNLPVADSLETLPGNLPDLLP